MNSTQSEVIETLGNGSIDESIMQVIEATMADIAGTYKE
jgi:hypothetical protein